jgi:hypothetical protein
VLKKGLSWTLYHAERDSEGDLRRVSQSYAHGGFLDGLNSLIFKS